MFPSPPAPASNRTCIDCVRPCGGCAPESVANIQSGWRCQNTYTDGRSAVRNRIWDTSQLLQFLRVKAFRTVHSAIPCGCPAFALAAGQRSPSAPAFPPTASGDLRRYPGIRVGDTSGLTQAPQGDDRLLSRLTGQCTSAGLAAARGSITPASAHCAAVLRFSLFS